MCLSKSSLYQNFRLVVSVAFVYDPTSQTEYAASHAYDVPDPANGDHVPWRVAGHRPRGPIVDLDRELFDTAVDADPVRDVGSASPLWPLEHVIVEPGPMFYLAAERTCEQVFLGREGVGRLGRKDALRLGVRDDLA